MSIYVKGTVHKKAFPGTNAKDLKYHMKPTLSDETPDIAVIHVGTNNIPRRRDGTEQTPKEIASEIIDIGKSCQEHGVNKVLISSVLTRLKFHERKRVRQVNDILKDFCREQGFIYICNDFIANDFLWRDGIHLIDEGTNMLANNFIRHINQF